ncbi:MAG: T9SS type A sorting domain-containing protein [Bacteroidota bacterium]|nr:T9SS type A sorting domain-containing protein [Bacteroidota bacterium]
MKKTFYTILFLVFAFITYLNLVAFENGIVGLTKKNGNNTGCVCHDFMPDVRISVIISGPSNVIINDTAIYTLKLANGPAVAGGCDISTSLGTLYTSSSDTSLRRQDFFGKGFELTHRYPKLFTGDTLEFIFKYIAPSTPNVKDTIFANSNSVNHDTTSQNDRWNYADNFLINIIDKPLPVELSSFVSVIKDRNVELNWETLSEINNSGFDIERSIANPEGSGWSRVGNVAGNGTTTSHMNYSFIDRNLNSGNYNYRLKQIDLNGNFEYFNLSNEVVIGVPDKFELSQNYPNPFNPSTTIDYQLTINGNVIICVFDNSGKVVMKLVDDYKSAGYHTANLNASSLSSGVYFYKISSGNFLSVKKMVVVK